MRPNGYELQKVDIEGEGWADWGTRKVAHFD